MNSTLSISGVHKKITVLTGSNSSYYILHGYEV